MQKQTLKICRSGFSLVEVLIAAAIGGFIMLTLSRWMNNLTKSQRRMERKADYLLVKDRIYSILTDTNAWSSNPAAEVPKPKNQSNFFAFDIKAPYNLREVSVLGSGQGTQIKNCETVHVSCRLVFFDSQAKLIYPEEIDQLGSSYYKAVIRILAKDQGINRFNLPEMEFTVFDKHPVIGMRNNPRRFIVNRSQIAPKYDSQTAGKCYYEAIKQSNMDQDLAILLCRNANSLAPIHCYKKMKNEFKLSEDHYILLCNQSPGQIPLECFRKAIQRFKSNKLSLAKLCHQAVNMAPLECYSKMLDADKNQQLASDLCHRSINLDPYNCFLRITSLGHGHSKAILSLCPNWRTGK